jgi:hypothetical protein
LSKPLSHEQSKQQSVTKAYLGRAASTTVNGVADKSPDLSVVTTFRKWLHLTDPGSIEVMLGAYAANRLPGDPVWMLLVGASSGGKGEVINTFERLPYSHPVAHVSEASLLSGSSKDNWSSDATGGLLQEVGDFGIFVFKDLTSMFTQNRDERGKALSALRQCYDGSWVRPVGVDGARKLRWQGKLGILGGVTKAIDREHETMSKLGERFLFFRLLKIDKAGALEQARKVAKTRGQEAIMRSELSAAVSLFLDLDYTGSATPEISRSDEDWLAELVTLATRCRSYVARDSYSRQIEDPGDSEGPGRMMRALTQLWAGLRLVGICPERCRELIQKTSLDSMPPSRRVGFDYLVANGGKATVANIALTDLYPELTVRRGLQELECHGVVERAKEGNSEFWSIAKEWSEFSVKLKTPPPKIVRARNGSSRTGISTEQQTESTGYEQ